MANNHGMETKHYVYIVDDNKDINGWRDECPLDPGIIPNYLGINLCSVHNIEWDVLKDGQLLNLTINFKPIHPSVKPDYEYVEELKELNGF